MKLIALLALSPLLAHALITPEATELARLQQEAAALRHTLGGCSVIEGSPITGLDIVRRKQDKKAAALVNAVEADLTALESNCRNSDAALRLQAIQRHSAILANRLGIQGALPSSINDAYSAPVDESSLEAISEATVKGMDREVCPSDDLPHDLLSWHAFFLQHGYLCTVKTYKDISQARNQSVGTAHNQAEFDNLANMSLDQLKRVFRQEFAQQISARTMKIAFIPQLSYENGMLTGLWPYRWFMKQTEKTSYTFLQSELSRLGARVEIIYRNSMASLESQVQETEAGLARLNGPHLVISRSMGSRVMNEIRKREEQGLTNVSANIASSYNIGGTPNGSVIADYKSRPDLFYRGVFPQVSETLNLPVGLIAMDPRVVDHLGNTIYAALDRANLASMAHFSQLNAPGDANNTMKVYNLIFLSPGYQRATSGVDPVYTHMLSYGPTEGSAPLATAAVDTANSARVFYDLDHLAYWKLTPQQGLALYLRTLIAAKRAGLSF